VPICADLFLLGQWQTGSRKQKTESLQDQGLVGDENQCGRNFVERWMAVRPWENRLLDSNAKEGVLISDGRQAEDDKAKALNKPKKRVAVSTVQSNGTHQNEGTSHKKSHSDASGSSPGKSASVQAPTSLESSKMKAKQSDVISDEVSSQPSNLPSRSTSNPKERPEQMKVPVKKRLSLPNNGKIICLCTLLSSHLSNT
jgi:DNA-binding transcriptional regulator of glucitol operon